MAGLGKRRPPRQRSGVSGLAHKRPSDTRRAYQTDTSDELPDELEIQGLSHDGRGIARSPAGKTLFVEGALPGERVRVAVHRTRKRYDEAHLRELIEAAPTRVTPPCPYIERCGGCDLQHLELDAQRRHKAVVLSELLARQGVEVDLERIEVLASDDVAYRRRARLGVRVDADGGIHLGFRARRSHRLVSVESCTVLVPELSSLLAPLHQQLASLEAPRQVGHLELLASDGQVTLVIRQLREQPADLARWREWAGERGIAVGVLAGREQVRFEWLVTPPRGLQVTVPSARGPLSLGVGPSDFLQANAQVNQRMIETALDWLGTPRRVDEPLLDLFAGIGNFSLPLAASGYAVSAVEGSPEMTARLADNAAGADLDVAALQGNLHDEGQVARLLRTHDAEVVVLDPPREGAEALCRALAKSTVSRVLYIACDPATLSRDAAHLLQGGYCLQRVAMADMFVHTSHLESMVLFERQGPSPRQGVRKDG
ncbi:TRAM domain-containing protein [Halomonas sp. YLB-10]|uniref:TRAM domain-containing protein n=1 Tax=Halomonas sp. YLB-10 TaxID=2483111 RepID=UPI000F5D92A1|nr:TRAM domain-containing protein [Halomonas sp. YLB-10]RQW70745.1 TRAM domain-containing protein [Halomonas sp. YLB-10]